MQGGESIVERARTAAALARTEREARLAAMSPERNYRGVQQRKNRYYATIRHIHNQRLVWLGSYKTPEEAAYAWDAAARLMRGHLAKPNFPEPDFARAALAPEEVSTELVLALPTLAATPARRREPPAALAAQASFDNSLLSASSAAAEPRHQQFLPAAAPTTYDSASQSAAPPPVPRLTPKDLLLQIGLPGRCCPGGAQ